MKSGDAVPPAQIAACGGSEVLAQLLWNRGICDVEEVKKYFGTHHYMSGPPAAMLYDPEVAQRQKPAAREPEVSIALADIDERLLRGLYRLVSLCADAPLPVLVCRAVRLVNAAANGLGHRHARLLIEDEDGQQIPANWWHISPSLVPQGLGDAVFFLRVDDRFGRLELRAELISFNRHEATEIDPPVIPRPPFTVDDWRGREDARSKVLDLQGVQIWVEGGAVEDLPVRCRRDELAVGRPLVIWTCPPSPEVLRTALDYVQPEHLWICAAPVPTLEKGDFLRELAGVAKAVMAQRSGRINRGELAARMGQTEGVVLTGLDVLESMGLLHFRAVEERILLGEGDGKRRENTRGQPLADMLQEVAAYRRYIGKAAVGEWLH